MSLLLSALLFLGLLFCSGVFSGSESGFYLLSRLRVQAVAQEGRRSARTILRLLQDDSGLLITLLIGNNLMLELLTHFTEVRLESVEGIPPAWREIVLALVLTPVVFFFAELLPKDLFFLRRPHTLVGYTAPMIAVVKIVFYPLMLPLRGISRLLQSLFGLEGEALARVMGREAVLDLLEQSTRSGNLAPHAERLARNVLELRSITVRTEMIPWDQVEQLPASLPDEEQRARVLEAPFSRLPVVDDQGRVEGYVYQLDLLVEPGDQPVLAHRRPMPFLGEDMRVDEALGRLRVAGNRVAVVGSAERPLGLVALKDLVETISGELAGW